ncbi:aldo/keto reductase family oxidoreductase [Bacillus daqingensis]|uniref:Aldo/keto reductase family oxidoreductase n=1 Tax=Bacillus daqingensis TaxID=872396 RepID=A0ABV9NRU0_9BACI
MKVINIGSSPLQAGEVALGCMRMAGLSTKDADAVIRTSLEEGVTLFDHADIYGGGASEEVFGRAVDLKGADRDKLILQSKCGIRSGFYDFSKEHIVTSVEKILKRLGAENLDILVLHRPDVLMEPEEVASAFSELKKSGKVHYFGVSNHHPGQIELLKQYVDVPLIINQIQLSLMHTPVIDAGLQVNMHREGAVQRDGMLLEYCRKESMTIQAWSPFQHGMIEGPFIDNSDFPEVNKKLEEIAEQKGISKTTAAAAWLLRIPASIQPIIGSMTPDRIRQAAAASNVNLSREQWYELYTAAGNDLP